MTESSAPRASTCVSRIIQAPRPTVYRACLDPVALARWRVPDSMTGHMHAFDARAGGAYRMSLTYTDARQSPGGKTSEDTDTFEVWFIELVPDQKIVEAIVFESQDARFAGEMRMTTTLSDADGGTEITVLAEDLPSGIRPEDNRAGTEQALRKLAALVEEPPAR